MSKSEEKIKEYELLGECIRSGQVEASQIHEHFENDPEFKQWNKDTYLSQMQDSQENPYIGEYIYAIPDIKNEI